MPKSGCRIKSVLMIKPAPANVIASPRQKVIDNFCLRINHVPNATQSGAVLPSKVAFAAVVYVRDVVHSARSKAVKAPAKSGNQIAEDVIAEFPFMRVMKNGSSINMEKNMR